MYDETPARAWTHIIKPAGELEGHAAVAKVIASLLSFSMVLDVSGELDDSQLSSCDCSEAGASGMSTSASASQSLVLWGGFHQKLAAMASQTQEIVLQAIRSTMTLQGKLRQTVEELFPVTVILRQSDLHRSGIAAEREETRQRRSWVSALFRCCMHRVRTAELCTITLDHRTEAFFLNYTLVLRQQPEAMRAYRARVEAWVIERLGLQRRPS
jgi:hypothetical protein